MHDGALRSVLGLHEPVTDCPVDVLCWIFNVASQPIRRKKDLFAAVAVLLQQNYFKDHFRFIWRESNNRFGNRCGGKQTGNRSWAYIYVQLYKSAGWKIKIIPFSIMPSSWSKRCLSIYNLENCNLPIHTCACFVSGIVFQFEGKKSG